MNLQNGPQKPDTTRVVLFPSNAISRIDEFVQTERRLVAGAEGRRSGGFAHGEAVFLLSDGNVPEPDRGAGCIVP